MFETFDSEPAGGSRRMFSLVAQEVGVEDESPLLLVGISESPDDVGRDFYFQCDQFLIQASDVDLRDIRRQLRTVLTCGRPEYWPATLEIAD